MATTCAGKDPGVQVEPKIYEDEWNSSTHQGLSCTTTVRKSDADSRILKEKGKKKMHEREEEREDKQMM